MFDRELLVLSELLIPVRPASLSVTEQAIRQRTRPHLLALSQPDRGRVHFIGADDQYGRG